eukprot:TRINITY_DN7896_c0_g1_i6.p2 TRINITY_DN7896_c0_g1~~TRINITY_DN7896_c0_g1_i6.p2  ORF type:complete len:139 (-),score=29.85 TRINITY_DN7896_c0_g1_i6:172-588(-)
MQEMSRRMQELEKSNETLSKEIMGKTGQSVVSRGEVESLLDRVGALELLSSTLSQNCDTLKDETGRNRSDIAELSTELLGSEYTRCKREGNAGFSSGKSKSEFREETYLGKDKGGTEAEEIGKGRIPSIEARLDSVHR